MKSRLILMAICCLTLPNLLRAQADLILKDSLLIDRNKDGYVNPGDSLLYQLWLQNSGQIDMQEIEIYLSQNHVGLDLAKMKTTPIALKDTFKVNGNLQTNEIASDTGLLANDWDDFTSPAFHLVCDLVLDKSELGGTLTINQNGSFTYKLDDPTKEFYDGLDSFRYYVTDIDGNRDTSWVCLIVDSNYPPTISMQDTSLVYLEETFFRYATPRAFATDIKIEDPDDQYIYGADIIMTKNFDFGGDGWNPHTYYDPVLMMNIRFPAITYRSTREDGKWSGTIRIRGKASVEDYQLFLSNVIKYQSGPQEAKRPNRIREYIIKVTDRPVAGFNIPADERDPMIDYQAFHENIAESEGSNIITGTITRFLEDEQSPVYHNVPGQFGALAPVYFGDERNYNPDNYYIMRGKRSQSRFPPNDNPTVLNEAELYNPDVMDPTHIQGIAELIDGRIVLSHNTEKSYGLALIESDASSGDFSILQIGHDRNHPGAIQACGNVVVFPMTGHASGTEYVFVDASDPIQPKVMDSLSFVGGAGAPGICFDPRGFHYLLLGSDLYYSNGRSLFDPKCKFLLDSPVKVTGIRSAQGGTQLINGSGSKIYVAAFNTQNESVDEITGIEYAKVDHHSCVLLSELKIDSTKAIDRGTFCLDKRGGASFAGPLPTDLGNLLDPSQELDHSHGIALPLFAVQQLEASFRFAGTISTGRAVIPNNPYLTRPLIKGVLFPARNFGVWKKDDTKLGAKIKASVPGGYFAVYHDGDYGVSSAIGWVVKVTFSYIDPQNNQQNRLYTIRAGEMAELRTPPGSGAVSTRIQISALALSEGIDVTKTFAGSYGVQSCIRVFGNLLKADYEFMDDCLGVKPGKFEYTP